MQTAVTISRQQQEFKDVMMSNKLKHGNKIIPTRTKVLTVFRFSRGECFANWALYSRVILLILRKLIPYARSFKRRVFAFHYAVNHPPINIILS